MCGYGRCGYRGVGLWGDAKALFSQGGVVSRMNDQMCATAQAEWAVVHHAQHPTQRCLLSQSSRMRHRSRSEQAPPAAPRWHWPAARPPPA